MENYERAAELDLIIPTTEIILHIFLGMLEEAEAAMEKAGM